MDFQIVLIISKRLKSAPRVNTKLRYASFSRLVKKVERGELRAIDVVRYF